MKQAFIERVQNATGVRQKEPAILDLCRGKTVLDVGCVGQARALGGDKWLHGHIAEVARSCVGVDIDVEGSARLTAEGYSVVHPDDLVEGDLYDVVVMGDVIEHISDIVSFLEFYAAYLKPGGDMIISTPNAFSLLQYFNVLLSNAPAVNPEHTVWLEPKTLSEIVERTSLSLKDFWWIAEEYDVDALPAKSWALHKVAHAVRRVRPYTSPNFMCVLTR